VVMWLSMPRLVLLLLLSASVLNTCVAFRQLKKLTRKQHDQVRMEEMRMKEINRERKALGLKPLVNNTEDNAMSYKRLKSALRLQLPKYRAVASLSPKKLKLKKQFVMIGGSAIPKWAKQQAKCAFDASVLAFEEGVSRMAIKKLLKDSMTAKADAALLSHTKRLAPLRVLLFCSEMQSCAMFAAYLSQHLPTVRQDRHESWCGSAQDNSFEQEVLRDKMRHGKKVGTKKQSPLQILQFVVLPGETIHDRLKKWDRGAGDMKILLVRDPFSTFESLRTPITVMRCETERPKVGKVMGILPRLHSMGQMVETWEKSFDVLFTFDQMYSTEGRDCISKQLVAAGILMPGHEWKMFDHPEVLKKKVVDGKFLSEQEWDDLWELTPGLDQPDVKSPWIQLPGVQELSTKQTWHKLWGGQNLAHNLLFDETYNRGYLTKLEKAELQELGMVPFSWLMRSSKRYAKLFAFKWK